MNNSVLGVKYVAISLEFCPNRESQNQGIILEYKRIKNYFKKIMKYFTNETPGDLFAFGLQLSSAFQMPSQTWGIQGSGCGFHIGMWYYYCHYTFGSIYIKH